MRVEAARSGQFRQDEQASGGTAEGDEEWPETLIGRSMFPIQANRSRRWLEDPAPHIRWHQANSLR